MRQPIIDDSNDAQLQQTPYEKYLGCIGSCLGCCCCTYTGIQTSSVGMFTKFGKFTKAVGSGLHYYNPLTENITQISLQTKIVQMPKQRVYSKDNMSIVIDSTLFYRVVDVYCSTYLVRDVLHNIMELTFVTLRTICGEYILQDLLVQRV